MVLKAYYVNTTKTIALRGLVIMMAHVLTKLENLNANVLLVLWVDAVKVMSTNVYQTLVMVLGRKIVFNK